MRSGVVLTLCLFGGAFVIIALWTYRELVALTFGVLIVLVVLVHITIAIDEQRLRHKRLRPSENGYEIPLAQPVPTVFPKEVPYQERIPPYEYKH